MNGFDWAMLAVLTVAFLLGLWAGIVRLALMILSLTLGAMAAVAMAEPVAELLRPWVRSPEVGLLAGFLVVFGLTLVLFSLVAWFLRRAVAALGLGWADRFLGAVVGASAVLAAAAVLSLGLVRWAPESPWAKGSWAVPRLAALASDGIEQLPRTWMERGRELTQLLRTRVEALRRRLPAGGGEITPSRGRPRGAERGHAGTPAATPRRAATGTP
jgi:uncharacterized membrane protein required for colicin V production